MGRLSRLSQQGKMRMPLQQWFLLVVVIVSVYLIVLLLPRPEWICGNGQGKDARRYQFLTPDLLDSLRPSEYTKKANGAVEIQSDSSLSMFPLYLKQQARNNANDTFPVLIHKKHGPKPSHHNQEQPSSSVNIFYLKNFDFSGFGRTWVNEEIVNKTNGKQSPSKHEKQLEGHPQQVDLKRLRFQRLPDCVSLSVPFDARPTKICVHFPYHDNFISNRLRDTGEWEMNLVYQMDEFFRAHPDSQLVDLGCNVGVFTLFAASLGKPALALDILPSNLALIQLSIATNDEILASEGSDAQDVDEILEFVGHGRKKYPKYSELITTVHNAVYSKRTTMYVYLKGDLNLGGTEVKEYTRISKSASTDVGNKLGAKSGRSRKDKAGRGQKLNSSQTESENFPTSAPDGTVLLVEAICLDDLIPHVRPNASVFLKMDIEGSEPEALMCASNFFMYVDVRVVLMEILFHKYSEKGRAMASFLLRQNMVPSEDVNGRRILSTDLKDMYSWPENMFWIKIR